MKEMKKEMKKAVALFDYRGSTDEELNFYEGDVFHILNDDNSDWWWVIKHDHIWSLITRQKNTHHPNTGLSNL